jgi:hypothetical protein
MFVLAFVAIGCKFHDWSETGYLGAPQGLTGDFQGKAG